ncbi:MAG: DUF4286 family protein [Gammaproteobacteria bacterium]|nr:DUF4286 family protein [Gammaproteobacteria bacterium]MDH3409806.1 DUF4286 family protein [Gammaproteobacteria bacterium]
MTSKSGPIYEVTFFIDRDVAEACDLWLEDHVRASLREPGIVDCNSFSIADDDDGRARRVCLHVLESDAALDAFLDGRGTDIDTELVARFPQQAYSQGRVLREDQSPDLVPGASPDCLNCGTKLRGQYCGNCGQRSRSRLISLWELISDAFGDLFEIDSRLWQTLIPLLIRPGRLTHDYLQGRRARYMPPFRMYLVLSLLFFVVAFFDPREELGLLFEPQPEVTSEEDISEAVQEEQEILDDLAEGGIISGIESQDDVDIDTDNFRMDFDISGDDDDSECNIDASDLEDLPKWLARRVTVERMQRICERTQLDDGRALVDNLLDNIPAALIVLLPLMAFVLKVLYPLSKRYYVEHLLFFVHFHAFFFLILSLQILFARLAALLRIPEELAILTLVITSFYVPVYLFVSMRRVYGQGRTVTFLKYVVLFIAYLLGFFATMFGALAIAAFSI